MCCYEVCMYDVLTLYVNMSAGPPDQQKGFPFIMKYVRTSGILKLYEQTHIHAIVTELTDINTVRNTSEINDIFSSSLGAK